MGITSRVESEPADVTLALLLKLLALMWSMAFVIELPRAFFDITLIPAIALVFLRGPRTRRRQALCVLAVALIPSVLGASLGAVAAVHRYHVAVALHGRDAAPGEEFHYLGDRSSPFGSCCHDPLYAIADIAGARIVLKTLEDEFGAPRSYARHLPPGRAELEARLATAAQLVQGQTAPRQEPVREPSSVEARRASGLPRSRATAGERC